ncbi:hypothetical protein BKA62DRAFT_694541 [Auriculariales sp. MPI-PUGE-AT-0066]|nr:hypothetical protein BKA62DRAFT_694541 [Auriculariales sp. MPI-PUGE-AT-0066]
MSAGITYDLLYFPIYKARADVARLLLAAGGAQYTNSAPPPNEFGSVKNDQLFGKLPCLTVKQADGSETKLWESRAIHEYLADELDLLPKEKHARAEFNSLTFSIYEAIDTVGTMSSLPTPELRKEYFASLRDAKLPDILSWHEKYLAAKNKSGPYYGGDKITFPDVVLYSQSFKWKEMFGEANPLNEEKTPRLLKLVKACEEGKLGEAVRNWETKEFPGRGMRWKSDEFKFGF